MMSKKDESMVLTFKVDLDTISCPNCGKTGTLCYADTMTKEGEIQAYHCLSPKCQSIIWGICVIITELEFEEV